MQEEDYIVDDGLYYESYYSDEFVFIDPHKNEEITVRNPYQISIDGEDISGLKSSVKNILSTELGFKVIKGTNGKRNLKGYFLYCYRLVLPEYIIFNLQFYRIKESQRMIILYKFMGGSKQYGIEVFHMIKNHLLLGNDIYLIETGISNIVFQERTVLGFILSILDDFSSNSRTTLLVVYYLERLKEQNNELFRNVIENIVLRGYIEDMMTRYNIGDIDKSNKDIGYNINMNMKRLVYDRLLSLFDL